MCFKYIHNTQIIKLDICNVKLFLLLSIPISDQFPCFVTIPDTEYFIADTFPLFRETHLPRLFSFPCFGWTKNDAESFRQKSICIFFPPFFLQSKNLSRSSMQLSLSSSLSFFLCVLDCMF